MISESLTAWQSAARPGRRAGASVEAHRALGSTNDRARQLLDQGAPDGMVVVAEEQTAGRGRRGRSWASPPGVNLTASLVLRLDLPASDGWQLGLAVALALRDACTAISGATVAVKWPNDLVAPDDRKLGGLLVETSIEGDRLRSAVAGFGINVNWRRAAMPPDIAESATSLVELAGQPLDRVVLLREALDALDTEIAAVEQGRSPLGRYRAACATIDTMVTVETPAGSLSGRVDGIDDHGALVVNGPDGVVAVSSGEVVRVRRAAS